LLATEKEALRKGEVTPEFGPLSSFESARRYWLVVLLVTVAIRLWMALETRGRRRQSWWRLAVHHVEDGVESRIDL